MYFRKWTINQLGSTLLSLDNGPIPAFDGRIPLVRVSSVL